MARSRHFSSEPVTAATRRSSTWLKLAEQQQIASFALGDTLA
jgi:hypothetical protein